MAGRYLALDIGGTKLLVAATDSEGRILARAESPTPAPLDEGLQTLDATIAQVLEGERPLGIGAAIGGPIDYAAGVVSPLHQPHWRHVPLQQLMEDKYACPFEVDVDTNVAALGEYHAGEHRSPLLYLTLSTGMGGALLIDGQIYRGANGAHPEPGHIHLRPGAICACGADGCLEAYVSGRGLERVYCKDPETLTLDEWQQVAEDLGLGLRTLAATYAPALIVLGGGIALAQAAHLVPKATQVMNDGLRLVPHPEVRPTTLGRDNVLRGAIALALAKR